MAFVPVVFSRSFVFSGIFLHQKAKALVCDPKKATSLAQKTV